MKNRFLIIILVLASLKVVAQDQVQFSQVIKSQGLLNPAYCGSRDALSGVVFYRNQWVGIEGAPKSLAMNLHSPIPVLKGLGVGVSIINDTWSINQRFDSYLALSYSIPIDNTKLAFGLQTGFNSYKMNFDKAINSDGTAGQTADPNFVNYKSYTKPNVGFGIYYAMPQFFVGYSAPQMLYHSVDSSSFSIKTIQSYLYAGAVFDIGEDFKLKPTFLLRQMSAAPLQIDFGANVLIYNICWVGINYRMDDAIVFSTEFKIGEICSLGYSYDFVTSKLNTLAKGTHEVFISFDLISMKPASKKKVKVPSIRYF